MLDMKYFLAHIFHYNISLLMKLSIDQKDYILLIYKHYSYYMFSDVKFLYNPDNNLILKDEHPF